MNANELADEFKNRDWDEVDAVLWCEKAATMLRKQRAEIAAFKAKTLTDEEMEIIAEALLMIGFKDDFINYDLKEKAQAILRKAQEK